MGRQVHRRKGPQQIAETAAKDITEKPFAHHSKIKVQTRVYRDFLSFHLVVDYGQI